MKFCTWHVLQRSTFALTAAFCFHIHEPSQALVTTYTTVNTVARWLEGEGHEYIKILQNVGHSTACAVSHWLLITATLCSMLIHSSTVDTIQYPQILAAWLNKQEKGNIIRLFSFLVKLTNHYHLKLSCTVYLLTKLYCTLPDRDRRTGRQTCPTLQALSKLLH